MYITIGKPCAISEKGGRSNNEDFIYPSPEFVDAHQKLFLVCDGVGGAEKGEVASQQACELFTTYFDTFLEGNPSTEFINKAIRYTEAHFDTYIDLHAEAKGMATTLTMLYCGNNGITLAYVGDSRIYHIRKGTILYQTEDHSLINSLVRLGKITPEEAIKHPQKNVILRAIQGTFQPTEADVKLIEDVQPGDYFFMCTDGVLENLTNEELASFFKENSSSEVIKDLIVEQCMDKTRDNYSFYIIPIQNVQDSVGLKQNIRTFFYSFV